MTPRIDKLNRFLLVAAGLLLLLTGAGALLLGVGAFGEFRADLPVVDDQTTEVWRSGQPWVWPVIGAACAFTSGLLIWWLTAQLRTRRLPRLELDRSNAGATRLVTAALAHAARAEAEELDTVNRARARMLTLRRGHELEITVWLAPPYDVPEALRELESTVVAHARDAVGDQTLKVRVHVEADLGTPSRVH